MTFAAFETSQQSGRPTELFEFAIGTSSFRYTSGEVAVTVGANTFVPLEISRSAIRFDSERNSDGLQITVPASNALVRKYINVVPGQQATLTVYRLHRNDPDEGVAVIYKGLVRTVGFDLLGYQATISIQELTSSINRSAPRMVYSATCNHVLFDPRCKVNSTAFRYQGTALSISADTLTVNGLSSGSRPDGWATGGYVVAPSGVDYRLILEHTGNSIRLLLPFPSDTPVVGLPVEVFAGCKHDLEVCDAKFNNVPNFGGFRWVPRENVFIKGL